MFPRLTPNGGQGASSESYYQRTRFESIVSLGRRSHQRRLAFATVVASIAEKQRLTIGIEDGDSAQLVWRGCVGSARFDAFESGNVHCHLVLTLDDWFGIFPGFSSFYFA